MRLETRQGDLEIGSRASVNSGFALPPVSLRRSGDAVAASDANAGSTLSVLAPADHDRKREAGRKPGEAGRKSVVRSKETPDGWAAETIRRPLRVFCCSRLTKVDGDCAGSERLRAARTQKFSLARLPISRSPCEIRERIDAAGKVETRSGGILEGRRTVATG
jgi:hypothetical protein